MKIAHYLLLLLFAPMMAFGQGAVAEQVAKAVTKHDISDYTLVTATDQDLKDFDTGLPKSMDMTELEKTALVDFLKTLTDNALVTDEKFSNPFK